jgi:hypothetical protein
MLMETDVYDLSDYFLVYLYGYGIQMLGDLMPNGVFVGQFVTQIYGTKIPHFCVFLFHLLV